VVRDSFDRALELRAGGGKPRYDGRHQDTGVDARVDQLADSAEALERVRRAWFQRPPGLFIHGRYAHEDVQEAARASSTSTSQSRTTIGPS